MQRLRGFLYFEGSSYEETAAYFDFLRVDMDIAFFEKISRYDREIEAPGVFLSGKVSDQYSSADIVRMLRQKVDLDNSKNCDVSIESEDRINHLKKGKLKGNYAGIRILPPYSWEQALDIASDIGRAVNAKDLLVRTVEGAVPSACIDIIAARGFEKIVKPAEQILSDEGLRKGEDTFFCLR